MNDELKIQIQGEIQGSPVHVFMKGTPQIPMCGFSKAVCDVFNALSVPFTTTDTLQDLDTYRATLGEVTNWPTIPQVFVNGEFIGGCDIVIEMYQSGELQKMLSATAPTAAGENAP